jgi:hypothetical protein
MNQKRLKDLLHYDPITGKFTWKVNHGHRRIGTEAGYVNDLGYRIIMIDYCNYRAGRLAWLYMYGVLPDVVDHKKHWEKSNDCISNLQPSSYQKNALNMPKRSDNTSGITGVCWHTSRKHWIVQIWVNKKKLPVQTFTDFFEACCCRKSLENKYGFSPYHGK